MSELRLPRLLSDGVVLQRRKSIHIWGWDEAGAVVTAGLQEVKAEDAADNSTENSESATGICASTGRFDLYLPARESGGPFELVVSDDKGASITVKDVMIGLVWFCSGQSNMELPIARVKDKYPEVLNVEPDDRIRTFKIVEETCYDGPYEEHHTGDWKSVSQDTIMNFSATGYFFAKHLSQITGQTVGFINASLGGSRVYSWMSRQMLEGYDDLLAIADQYADDEFRNGQMQKNMVNGDTWRGSLNKADEGIKNHWESDDFDTRKDGWGEFEIPNFFAGTELDGFIGSVWFRRKFDLPKELAGKAARVFLGTMVDADVVYVNGQKVGETFYQYPPRKYDIPEGLTREKDNTIAIRLCVETGIGRFTPDKDYKIFNDKAEVRLDGKWDYKVAARCEKIPETDFINWKPTGLYNAMTAPCHNFSIDGVIWYQGESNVEDGYDYNDFTKRMVKGYRKAWQDASLPFIGVQLPNFVIDQLPREDDWGGFRIVQSKLLDIPGTGLAVTLGLGEDNDLHPVTKEPIGERLALWASYLKYCYEGEYTGPVVSSVTGVIGQGRHPAVAVELTHCKGLTVLDAGKGTEIEDMYILDESGMRHKASAILEANRNRILLMCDDCKNHASKVQWCCENTYHGGLITNETGIPMSPFELPITERE